MSKQSSYKWVGVYGRITTQDNTIHYIPTPAPALGFIPTGEPQASYAHAKSNIDFESGKISFEVHLSNGNETCMAVLNNGTNLAIHIGINTFNHAYGIIVLRNGVWEWPSPTASAAPGQFPPKQEWIPVEVRVTGSTIQLLVDDVLVCTASQTVPKSQLGLFFQGDSPVQVRNFKVEPHKPTAFVVMQFTDEYSTLFQDVIRPTCENFGYKVIRGDDTSLTGPIIDDISRLIRESSIIIADITPDNPNVFYEVGYSHALAKPTILLSDRRRGKLPFDVSGFRTLFYDNTIGGKSAVESSLKKHLEALSH